MKAWARILWEIESCSGSLRAIRRALIITNVFLFLTIAAIVLFVLYIYGIIWN